MGVEQRKSVVEHPQALLGGTAIKPPERHGWEAIQYLIYDKDTGAIFTRTPKSWALIFIFYCIYYSCLAAFWYGMLNVFFIFLPENMPKYTLDDSIIGSNPGVGMRPHQPDATIDSSMLFLQYDDSDDSPSIDFETPSNADWAKRYELFVDRFANLTQTRDCNFEDYNGDGEDSCRFDVNVLGECGQKPYGFLVSGQQKKVAPCVLLKINRIYNWKPEPYTDEDLENDDPEDPIPENVKTLIRSNPRKLYLDCVGENPADREALKGNVQYFPSDQSISYKYFPYTQAGKNYHNPVVAVKFNDMPLGQLLHIECKLWTKGAVHSSKDRIGQVHFELILDDNNKK